MIAEIALFIFFVISIAALSYENQSKLDTAYRKTVGILRDKLGIDVPEDRIKITGLTPEEYEEKKDTDKECLSQEERYEIEDAEEKRNSILGAVNSGFVRYTSEGKYEVVVPVTDATKEIDLARRLSHEIGGHVYQKSYGAVGRAQNKILLEEAVKRKELEDATKDYMKGESYDKACEAFENSCREKYKDDAGRILESMENPALKLEFVREFMRKRYGLIDSKGEGDIPVNRTVNAIKEKERKRELDRISLDISGTSRSQAEKLEALNRSFEKFYADMGVETADDPLGVDSAIKAQSELDKIEHDNITLRNDALNKIVPLEKEYQKTADKVRKLEQSNVLEEGWSRIAESNALTEYVKEEYKDNPAERDKLLSVIELYYSIESKASSEKPGSGLEDYAMGKDILETISGGDFEKQKQIALKLKSDVELRKEMEKYAGIGTGGISGLVRSIKNKVLSS